MMGGERGLGGVRVRRAHTTTSAVLWLQHPDALLSAGDGPKRRAGDGRDFEATKRGGRKRRASSIMEPFH